MTQILVLDGHPAKGAFSSAIAETYAAAARAKGHQVRVCKLSEMDFDPDFGVSAYRDAKPLEQDLQAFWDDLVWSQHFVVAHPLWWGGMPAKLKGIFDRAFLHGTAFQYERGKAIPKPLLNGRTAEVLVTADTPAWIFYLLYGSPLRKQTEKQILTFCGFKMTGYAMFSPIRGSSVEQREKYLKRAARLGGRVKETTAPDSSLAAPDVNGNASPADASG